MTNKSESRSADVIVVGGGLAGLTAAAVAARAGRTVALFEKGRDLGGRAATQDEGGFLFNMGPHALYRGSAGRAVLDELGVTYSGKPPSVSGGYALAGGRKHTLPGGLVSLITTSLFRLPAKLEVARLLSSLGRLDPEPLQRHSVDAWLSQTIRHEEVRCLLRGLVRLSTYANAPDRLSAGAALHQLQLALGQGVLYLDGGWQTLVEGLRRAAQGAGARLFSGVKVEAVEASAAASTVRIAGDQVWTAGAVVLAGGPAEASTLVQGGAHPSLRRWVEDACPVRAACLDIGLASLPRPSATFALGVDEPLYLSVHSAAAKLGPENGALIHVAKYLAADDDSDARATERQLEGAMDLLQPGWRNLVRQRRFLPRMIVSHDLPAAARGGLAGRASVAVPGAQNLYVAGDWVGDEGLLADASFASGRKAGLLAAAAAPLSAAA